MLSISPLLVYRVLYFVFYLSMYLSFKGKKKYWEALINIKDPWHLVKVANFLQSVLSTIHLLLREGLNIWEEVLRAQLHHTWFSDHPYLMNILNGNAFRGNRLLLWNSWRAEDVKKNLKKLLENLPTD